MTVVTAQQAASILQVPVGTVRGWYEHGLLASAGRATGRGRPHVYRWRDVLAAERASRAHDPAQQRARDLAQKAAREA